MLGHMLILRRGVCNLDIVDRTWPCWHRNPGRPASRAVRNKSVSYEPPGLRCFVTVAGTKTVLPVFEFDLNGITQYTHFHTWLLSSAEGL